MLLGLIWESTTLLCMDYNNSLTASFEATYSKACQVLELDFSKKFKNLSTKTKFNEDSIVQQFHMLLLMNKKHRIIQLNIVDIE